MPTPHDIDLMQHADGELDDDELEARVESDAALHSKLDALAEMSELVRGRLELAADDVPDAKFAAMWREIDRNIETSRVVEPARAADEPVSIWRRIGSWFDHYRGHMLTGVVSAGAVAALALVLRSSEPEDPSEIFKNGPIVPVKYRTPPQIESLDTPEGTSSVISLEPDEDGNTTVIWVTPADTVEGI